MYNNVRFQSGAINPLQCFKEGWRLIKDQYWLFFGLTAVTMLLGSAVPLGIIMGAMFCGLYTCLLKRMRGETVSFDMIFKGFDHFVQSLIATLVQIIPAIVVLVPFYILLFIRISTMSARGRQPDPSQFFAEFIGIFAIFFIAMMAIGLIFGAIVIFTYPLIVDRGLNAIDALKTSAQAAFANLGGLVGLLLLNMVLSLIGVLFCYVGCFFVLPVSFAAFTVAYRSVFPENY